MTYQPLTTGQVALAATLIAINGGISLALGLGLGRRLLIGATRMVIQLSIVGLVLAHVFAIAHWGLVLGLGLWMASVAGISAVGRTKRRFPGIWTASLLSMWASSWLVTGLALGPILGAAPWYRPQFAIPLLGMILGNTLNGIALGLDRLLDGLADGRAQVELLLSLGATRWEAARPTVQAAIRTGMIPITNVMMVAGLVSLPGMMTGQMLAGVPPAQAVRYQIVILFLIAAGTALGTIGVVLGSVPRLFNGRHQFLAHRIRRI